jgi:hypothetical protein
MLPSSGTAIAPVHRVAPRVVAAFRDRMDVAVQPQTIERRVERLEERVTSLEELPHRIDELTGPILQLRAENGSEFSALRSEMRSMGEGIVTQLRGEMRSMGEGIVTQLRGEMRSMDEGIVARLRGEMQAMRDELKSHALVLPRTSSSV